MVLPNVQNGDPHVAAHNAERLAVNDLDTEVQLKALNKMNEIDLGASLDYIGRYRIIDDGTPTANWPDRWQIEYDPLGAEAHATSWFNEYGELRLTPGKINTVAFRIFVGEKPIDWTARNPDEPILEIVSDRTNRTQKFAVQPNGHVLCAAGATFQANVVAPNVANKVVTWPTGSEPTLSGVPDGTLWVEYEP